MLSIYYKQNFVAYLHESQILTALASLGAIAAAAALASLGAIAATAALATIVDTGFFNFDIRAILAIGSFLLIHLSRRS